MFDCADGSRVLAASCLEAPRHELRRLGFVPPPRHGADGFAGSGTILHACVQDIIDGGEQATTFLRRLAELVGTGAPVCLSAAGFGREESAVDAWRAFCEITGDVLQDCAGGPPPPATCIPSNRLPLEAYCLIADSSLGSGRRFVYMDDLQPEPRSSGEQRQRSRSNWHYVWRQRSATRPLMPVYGGLVRSACPLLSGEVADGVHPFGGLYVPSGSAWVPVGVHVARFADADGRVEEERLHRALLRALSIVDELSERLNWPCPRQRADARENRRIAFMLTGFGDLVTRSGREPTDFSCLTWLGEVAQRIRRCLYDGSAALAAQDGPLPALSKNPAIDWSPGAHREGWNRRWQEALRRAAVRHRNLIVISPYSVLPSEGAFGTGFMDLLPLIAHADAWCFADPPAFADWDVARFRQFHRRASAIIRASDRASFIAAGV